MNTVGRSLEIAAIGLGQAGGNIAAELQRRGYRALAFNTARTDLSSLGAGRLGLPDSQRIYIGLEGFDGAGSDADYGRDCIDAHADTIRAAVKEHAVGSDVVLLAAGLGGGTGSCAAEFTKVLEDLALPIVILTTLPHGYESGIAKVNALRGVRDLARTPAFGWTLIDNARLGRLHRDVPIGAYFETINREIVEPLDVLNRLHDRQSLQAIRTLDGEDFRALLLSGGVLSYTTSTLPKLAADAVLDAVRSSLADNPMMPAGAKLVDVAHLGLVIEASERALAESPFSLYEEIAQQLKQETGGAAVYVGLYRQLDADDTTTTVRVMSASHALPSAIDQMLTEAEREAGTIQRKMQQRVPALDLADLERLRLQRRPSQRGARAPGRSPAVSAQREPAARGEPEPPVRPPARPMVKVAPRAPSPAAAPPRPSTNVEALRQLVASAPATAAATPASPAPDPSRGRYERLANAFADAKNEGKRLYIARELVAAQRSGEALERFYAVNAMVRVDPAYFRDALQSAAKDADAHVADLARRALEKLASAS